MHSCEIIPPADIIANFGELVTLSCSLNGADVPVIYGGYQQKCGESEVSNIVFRNGTLTSGITGPHWPENLVERHVRGTIITLNLRMNVTEYAIKIIRLYRCEQLVFFLSVS